MPAAAPGSLARIGTVTPIDDRRTAQEPRISNRIVTVPNVLSFIRLLLVPVFFVLIIDRQEFLALITLTIASISDYLDGIIARRFGLITRLGQLLDPAADRLFIFAALVGLSISQIVPWWFVAIVVLRDVLLVVIGVVLANHGFGPLPVHHLGKTATFCLYYALPILMLGAAFPVVEAVTVPLGWAFAIWGTVLYWWAGYIYLRETVRVIRIPSAPHPTQSDTLER